MPSYEVGTSTMMYQFFPGELFAQGAESLGVTGLKSPIVIPSDFYSNPERYTNDPSAQFATHAMPLQATLVVYDPPQATALLFPEIDTTSRIMYQSPRSWRDVNVYSLFDSTIYLIIDDLLHSHTLDSLILTQDHVLVIQELLHSHLLDNVSLTQDHILVLQELLHSHSLDSIVLTQVHSLAIQELLHAHLLDGTTLESGGGEPPAAGVISILRYIMGRYKNV